MEKILDVREMVPKERHPMIFDTFKALAPGERFILVNDHDPRPLLYQFQNEHNGDYEWWPLEQGPSVWRIAIARTKEKLVNRSVTDYFQTDHRRLDAIYEDFSGAMKDGLWAEAEKAFKEFNVGLRRHIKAEEEILFPVFEDKTGMHGEGPTAVMRMEHKDIRELLDKILSLISAKDAKAKDAAFTLVNILSDHNMKEEHILYPESDSFMSDPERAEVIKKTQTL